MCVRRNVRRGASSRRYLDQFRRGCNEFRINGEVFVVELHCDTLIVLAKLQCISYQQLPDSPGIDSILLSIHDSIEILGIVCL